MAGVSKYNIADLDTTVTNAMIVGIIIAKQEPRIFADKKGSHGGDDEADKKRGVWNFTVRDSPEDAINVSVWGSSEFIRGLAASLHIGDIVDIITPRVLHYNEDKFTPWVNSAFSLALDERHSRVQTVDGPPQALEEQMKPLMRIPTRPTTNFITLGDVQRRQPGRSRDSANLLAAVCRVWPMRHIVCKNGRPAKCREVVLMDYEVKGLSMTLWNPELIERAENWKAGKTVLFLADATVGWNAFKRCTDVGVGPRTVVTEDPDCLEANTLRSYTSSQPLALADQLDHLATALVSPASVNTVMSVHQLSEVVTRYSQQEGAEEAEQGVSKKTSQPTYALVFALLTSLDLDGCSPILTARCTRCRDFVNPYVGMCEECAALGHEPEQLLSFDLRVSFADHTGNLGNVHLTGQTAEKVLGVTAEEFNEMGLEQRTTIKWRLLLERCAVRVAVLPRDPSRQRTLVSILDCERADPNEAAARYPAN